MALTQDQIAQQMVAQLRALDPSASAEVGTPERKIIDTVAQQLAEAQVNVNVVAGAQDLDAKYGSYLDAYVGNFGFGRLSGSYASGFASFGRPTAAPYPITVPVGAQLQGSTTDASGNITTVVFQVTEAAVMATGQTSVTAPIQATITGAIGNLPANTITAFANVTTPMFGITQVSNPSPTTNGSDSESDVELKVRFRNTVFRNLSGTEDQYMALAVATQFATKANVIGPLSRYQEYLQVPAADDSTANGLAAQWTTKPSVIPYAKSIYTTIPYFLSDQTDGLANVVFYRQDSDFTLHAPPLNAGDTYRDFQLSEIPNPSTTPTNPNVTLYNVYTGADRTVQLPRPSDVVLVEFSYTSTESRNDLSRNITNCVDVYVNGTNPITATCTVAPPVAGVNLFTGADVTNKFYNQNFRRAGQPDTSPAAGSIFMGLFWQPVVGLPTQISVGSYTYFLGTHYWCVQDITSLGNTVRARNGIEWHPTAKGMAPGDPQAGPYTGQPITTTGATSFTITGYTYDKNIVDLQTSLEAAKQVTTDVLAHSCTTRYFKLDLTVVYSSGASPASVNAAISIAVSTYFAGQYFGSTIQLSDLLTLVRNVTGVQNVRWSNSIPVDAPTTWTLAETDINGTIRSGAQYLYTADFYLRDNELPALPTNTVSGDTLPGLILRARAQNTFSAF